MLDDEHLSGTSFLSVKIGLLQIFTIFYHLVSLFRLCFTLWPQVPYIHSDVPLFYIPRRKCPFA